MLRNLSMMIVLILDLFYAGQLFAQSYPENIIYRFAYESSFLNFEGGKKNSELKYLDISKSFVKFESANQVLRDEVRDSLVQTGASNDEILRVSSRLPLVREYSTIIKNLPEKGERTIVDFALRLYTYTEPVEKINWEQVSGDTIICDFECKKAECTYRGRNWTAWYCTDIPINEGPWKFSGLPGLIMCAYDEDDCFSFTCVGMEEPENMKIRIPDAKQYVKCSRKDFLKAKKRLTEDPGGFEKSMGVTSTNADGSPLIYKTRKAIMIENE